MKLISRKEKNVKHRSDKEACKISKTQKVDLPSDKNNKNVYILSDSMVKHVEG